MQELEDRNIIVQVQVLKLCCAIFVGLLLLLGFSAVKAESKGTEETIRVIILKSSPPQFMTTREGPSGLAIDMISEVARRASLNIEFVPVDLGPQVFTPLANGSADVLANVGISKERDEFLEFTDPYEIFDIKIFIRNESANIQGIDDLKGKALGVQENSELARGLVASGDYKIVKYQSYEQALLGLLSAEVNAVTAPVAPFLFIARGARLDSQIRFVGSSLFEVKRGFGLPKGRLILRDKLNTALLEFKKTDDYINLMTKWYGSATPYWTVNKVIVLMAVLFILFVSVLLSWRYSYVVKLNRRMRESEDRFETSHKFSNTGTWEHNFKTGALYWSRMVPKMFGGEEGKLTTRYENFLSSVHPQDREYFLAARKSCIENNTEYSITYRIVWPDGSVRWLAVKGDVIRNIQGKAERMLGTVQDITERKQIEDNLLTQSQITTHMEEGATLVRISDQTLVYTNSAFDEMFGYAPGELLGKHVSILNAPSEVDLIEVDRKITIELEAKGVWRGEFHNIKKDGTAFWCSVTLSSFDHPVYGYVGVSIHTDISERKSMNEKLSYQASHDSLTGLISRYEFEKRVNSLLSNFSIERVEHAMCFLDLDQFKVINDTCGHAAGDELLRQLGRLLGGTVSKRDTLARLGGDEFGVLMEYCTLEQAYRTANKILEVVMDHQFFWDGKSFRIGVSIGLVAINEANGNFTDLFQKADAACYMAKDLGRNRIHAYHPDDDELSARHGEIQWVARINQALDEDRFCLYAQPIISLNSDDHRHYEILVRMLNEEGGIIPPGAFLPAAERYNIIEKLDAWVLSHTCEFLAKHAEFTAQIDFVTINLSGQSLTNERFLQSIFRIFTETGMSPKKFCFEVTETAAVSNMNSAITFINSLKAIGCQFALDDFGSGISSFGYLKNLPVDYLKIDGMFVKDIVDDPIDYAMVKSINEVGQVMGMKTIAEFVENDDIKTMLKGLGVNYGQGYGLGKPQPLQDLID